VKWTGVKQVVKNSLLRLDAKAGGNFQATVIV